MYKDIFVKLQKNDNIARRHLCLLKLCVIKEETEQGSKGIKIANKIEMIRSSR